MQAQRSEVGGVRRLEPGSRLVVASHNSGKVWEIRKLISPYGLEAVSAGDLKLAEPEETEATFEGNSRLKAVAAAHSAGLPALADDSGLEVACLGGAPGIYSARWAGPTKDFSIAMRKVADEVTARHGWAAPGPRANFICALCLAWPDGETATFIGRIDGVLVWPPRGANGFGYDPMFKPDGHEITFGEMDPRDKNALSHRARAFEAFKSNCLGEKSAIPTGEPSAVEGLRAAAQSVSTREEFVRFVAGLREDLKANADDWANPSLDRFLDAIGGHVTDCPAADEPVWRTMAKTLCAASRYK